MLDITDLNDTSSRVPNTKKILTLVMYFCGMFNFYIYTAGLISYLMVQRYEIPINTLDDILDHPRFKLLVRGGGIEEDFLKHSTNPHYKKIWESTKEQNGLVSSFEEAEKQLITDEQKIFLGVSPLFELMAENYPCHIVKTKAIYHPNYGAYPFNKHSPYNEVFSNQITKILEHGLETERHEAKKQDDAECEKQTIDHFRTLSYKDVNSAFVIFVFGCFLAIVYSATECLFKGY